LDHDEVLFRSGRNGIVPYLKIPLAAEGDGLIPDSIYVGPNSDIAAAEVAIESFLDSRDLLGRVEVLTSKTPYRP
jgi:hypothetical protein